MKNWDFEQLFSDEDYWVIATDGEIKSILLGNEPFHGKPTEVFAYLGIPKQTRDKIPGMVCVHGGGGKAFKEWVEMWVKRGYVAISMDLRGNNDKGQRLENAGPELSHDAIFDTSLAWKDLWTYHAIAAIIRCHNILRSLPEVNSEKIGITGISWGGYLTCIAAGVDTRFACAVPVYGCGHLQHNCAEEWMERFSTMTIEQQQQWHEKCDPSIYLGNITMPMLFVSGTNDFAYPMDSLKLSYSQPQGPVSLCIRMEMDHGHEPGWAPREIQHFADHHLRGEPSLPKIGPMKVIDSLVQANFSSEEPIQKGLLAYTNDTGKWIDRKWHLLPAEIEQDMIRSEVPSSTTVYYLAIEDKLGNYVSSVHEEIIQSEFNSISSLKSCN